MHHVIFLCALLVLMGCDDNPFHGLTLMEMEDMEHTGEPNLQVSDQGEVTLSYLREHAGKTTRICARYPTLGGPPRSRLLRVKTCWLTGRIFLRSLQQTAG